MNLPKYFIVLFLAFAGAVRSFAAPDLLGYNAGSLYFSVPQNSSSWGHEIQIRFAVANLGDSTAGTFKIKFYLSPNSTIGDAGDYLLYTYTINSLSAQFYTGTGQYVVLPTSNPFGSGTSFYVGMIVDADNQVAESNEANNKNQGANLDRTSSAFSITNPAPNIAVNDSVSPLEDLLTPFGNVPNDGNGGGMLRKVISIYNNGTAALSVTGLSLQTGTHFRIESVVSTFQSLPTPLTFPKTVQPDSVEAWDVTIVCDPTVNGSITDKLIITSNDSDQGALSVNLTATGVATPDISVTDSTAPTGDLRESFGSVIQDGANGAFSQRTIALRNPGTGPMTVNQNGITFESGLHFKLVSITSSTQGAINLATGAKTIAGNNAERWDVVVRFDPTVIGSLTDVLRIASNDPDEGTTPVSLDGTSVTPMSLTITDSVAPASDRAVNFGAVHADGTGKKQAIATVTLQNSGQAPVTFAVNGVALASATHFKIIEIKSSTQGVLSVASASTQLSGNNAEIWTITLAFDPSTAGGLSTSLSLTSDATVTPAVVSLSGNGIIVPDLQVTDNSDDPNDRTVHFGAVLNDGTGNRIATRTFTLKNVGGAPLIFNQNGISTPPAGFRIESVTSDTRGPVILASSSPTERTLAATQNETWTVVVAFDPTANGLYDGTFFFLSSNDPDEPSIGLVLLGIGAQPQITLQPQSAAPTLAVPAGVGTVVRWTANYPPGTGAIDLFWDADQNPSNGFNPIVTGLSVNAASYVWFPDSLLVGQEFFLYARMSDGGVASGSYSARKYSVRPASQYKLKSPVITTSQDYGWEVEVDGQIVRGTTSLAAGENTVAVPITLPNGSTGSYEFLVSRVNSLLDQTGYTYDEMRRPKTVTDGNGVVTTFTYDLAGRLIRKETSKDTVVEFAYDTGNRRVSMKDSTGWTFYEWDDLDRLTGYIMSPNATKGDADDLKVAYEYDLASRRTAMIYPGGERLEYTYDNADRLLSVRNVTRILTFSYEYNPTSGLLTACNRPNGIRTTYFYDNMGRLNQITHKKGVALVADYLYTLNAAGNATLFTTTLPGGIVTKEQYSYDNADRLTQVIYSNDAIIDANDKRVDYTYSGAGNRLSLTVTQNGLITEVRNYTYGNDNRLLRIADQNGNELSRYAYDGAGNRIQKVIPGGQTTYDFNADNQLVQIAAPSGVERSSYNGAGIRTSKSLDGVSRSVVSDVGRGLPSTVQEMASTGTIVLARMYGLDHAGEFSTQADFPVADRLQSVRQVTGLTGAVTASRSFDVFGNPSANVQGLGFAGEEHSGVDGLLFLRARFYDPENGVFLSKDPIGIQGGVNGYQYAGSDPVNKVDPAGTEMSLLSDVTYWAAGKLMDWGVSPETIISSATHYINASHVAVAAVESRLYNFGINELKPSYYFNALGHLATGRNAIDYENPYYKTTDTLFSIGGGLNSVRNLSKGYQQIVTKNQFDNFAASGNVKILGPGSYHSLTPVIQSGKGSNQFIIDPMMKGTRSASGQAAIDTQLIGYKKFYTADQIGSLGSTGVSNVKRGTLGLVDSITNLWDDVSGWFGGGGVLIDKAAQAVGAEFSDLRGVSFDPSTRQLVFLSTDSASATKDINMDYFYTATQAVYGSSFPPFLSLDPPAEIVNDWTEIVGDKDGVFEPGEWAEVAIRYAPLWDQQDAYVDLRFPVFTISGTKYGVAYRFTPYKMDGLPGSGRPLAQAGSRYGMRLYYSGSNSAAGALGFQVDVSDFEDDTKLPAFWNLTETSQDSYHRLRIYNSGIRSLPISAGSLSLVSDRQHRRMGGRVEDTRLGWVMEEADRVMKCLAVGKDSLTGSTYSSATVSVAGYRSIFERAGAGERINARLWFQPNEMLLKRYTDPQTGQATVVFDKSTVILLTEAQLFGQTPSATALAFATHFTANYDAFAALSFPVYDPTDPTGQAIINVKIFEMLREAMQAVSLARFLRDNNVPLDFSWLSSWKPPVAYVPKSVPTAYQESADASVYAFGGCRVHQLNGYTPSSNAQSVGNAVVAARPNDPARPTEDLKQGTWATTTVEGNVRSVAASFDQEPQDGNFSLAETDLSFASPGATPLAFTRYYQSAWTGEENGGAGWRLTRYALEFEAPAIYDPFRILKTEAGTAIPTDKDLNTSLREGTVRLVDRANGGGLEFESSLRRVYQLDAAGDPRSTALGLGGNLLPTFSAGRFKDGTTLVQQTDKTYKAITPSGNELLFDADGRLLQTKDTHGFKQTYGYSTNPKRLTTIADDQSQTITLTYGTNGKLASATGPYGSAIDYVYDAQGRLQSAVHRLTSSVMRLYTYTAANQLSQVTDISGRKVLRSTPDDRGRADLQQDARNNTFEHYYFRDAANNRRTTNVWDTASTLAASEKVSDLSGRVQAVKDVYGSWTTYGYAGTGLLPTSIQLPTPGRPAISIQRNSYELPTKMIDPAVPNAHSVDITYNAVNKPTRIVDTLNRITDISYNGTQDVNQVTRYLGATLVPVASYTYLNGYVKTVADALGHAMTINRDALGRVTSVVDPTGVTIAHTYDSRGRLWKTTDPRLSSQIIYAYDDLDRVTSITTPAGTTSFGYDPVTKWLRTTTDVLSRVVERQHNATTGDLISTTVQMGASPNLVTTYSYGRLGQLESVTPPGAQPINFSYDSAGQLLGTSETNAAALGAPKNVGSNRATHGIATMRRNHVFTWAAPDSDAPIVGYSYALDGVPDNTTDRVAGAASVDWNNVSVGSHTFQVKAMDSNGRWGAIAVFDLIIAPLTPWEQWRVNNFTDPELDNSAISSETANPPKDGIRNLMKYALNLNPKLPSAAITNGTAAGLPWVRREGGLLTITYQRDSAKSDISYSAERSTTLGSWTSFGVTEQVLGTSGTVSTIKASWPITDNAFIRLKVNKP